MYILNWFIIFQLVCRILDLIKSSNKQKGLDILGIIVRRQPTWLYHIMQHNLFKETLKLLKVNYFNNVSS